MTKEEKSSLVREVFGVLIADLRELMGGSEIHLPSGTSPAKSIWVHTDLDVELALKDMRRALLRTVEDGTELEDWE